MICIGDANTCDAVDFASDGTCTAFVAEVAASPIRRLGKLAIPRETFAIVNENAAAALRAFEMGRFEKHRI